LRSLSSSAPVVASAAATRGNAAMPDSPEDAALVAHPPEVTDGPAAEEAAAEHSGRDHAAAALPADGHAQSAARQLPTTQGNVVTDDVADSGSAQQLLLEPAALPAAAVPDAPVSAPVSTPASIPRSEPDDQPASIPQCIAEGATPPKEVVTAPPASGPAALEQPSSRDGTEPVAQPITAPAVAPNQPLLKHAAANAQALAPTEAYGAVPSGADAGTAAAETMTAGRHRRAAQPSAKVSIEVLSKQPPSISSPFLHRPVSYPQQPLGSSYMCPSPHMFWPLHNGVSLTIRQLPSNVGIK